MTDGRWDQEVDSTLRMARERPDFFEGLAHHFALPPRSPQTAEPQSKETEPASIQ